MVGTVEGGKKVAAKLKAFDPMFYKKIGAKARRTGTGGFASNPELARKAGAKGGSAVRKIKVKGETK